MHGLEKFKKEKSEKFEYNDGFEESPIEINLSNLDISDLAKLRNVIELKEEILDRNFGISDKFQRRLEVYFEEISDAYSDEDLRKTALVNVLRGEDIPPDVENLDLEGEYSVEEFLQGIANEIEEGTI